MNHRGQFFSPDLVIAVGVFVFGLALFFNASNAVFAQASLFDMRKESDEVAHSVLDQLVLTSGQPTNWGNFQVSDINSFGLANSPNVLDLDKIRGLSNYFNNSSTYSSIKTKMGFGPYDFYFRVIDSSDNVIVKDFNLEGGRVADDAKLKLVYRRIILVDSNTAVFEATVSLGN